MATPQSSNNDPTPEARTGDSAFLPVIVAVGITVLVILIAAVVFLKVRHTEAIPKPKSPPTTSRLVLPHSFKPNQPVFISQPLLSTV